ncbi:L-threonine 3-dehydrogenase [Paraburkholderia caffeinilytica]|nr:L-threonine 3-dehydrogenase [Paraburkholderia caffeinilytica]
MAVGAQTVITSSSDEKLKRASSLGANDLVNYAKHPEWDEEVLRVTEGKGVTHVLEIGGPDTFPKSLKVLAAGGTIAQIGVITGFGPTANLMRLQSINANIIGISVGSRSHLEATLDFVTEKHIQPVIDKKFAFEDVPAAFDYLRSGSHFGKIVVEI